MSSAESCVILDPIGLVEIELGEHQQARHELRTSYCQIDQWNGGEELHPWEKLSGGHKKGLGGRSMNPVKAER
jgi:hypothetical protein